MLKFRCYFQLDLCGLPHSEDSASSLSQEQSNSLRVYATSDPNIYNNLHLASTYGENFWPEYDEDDDQLALLKDKNLLQANSKPINMNNIGVDNDLEEPKVNVNRNSDSSTGANEGFSNEIRMNPELYEQRFSHVFNKGADVVFRGTSRDRIDHTSKNRQVAIFKDMDSSAHEDDIIRRECELVSGVPVLPALCDLFYGACSNLYSNAYIFPLTV